MNASADMAATAPSTQPKVRARLARALRGLSAVPGWRSLINKLVPQHVGSFVARNGSTLFAGNIGSFIDRQVYLFGGYERWLIEGFLSCVPQTRRGIVLDIGANVGTHSLAFAQVFRTVHAFEPNPMLWAQFERNILLNRFTNVHLHKVGLADRDAELMLHLIDKPNYGLGTFSAEEQYDLPLRPAATCPVRHAGNYLASIGAGPVDAVKIDVQGFEPEVLRGLAEVLKRDRPVVWCEIGAGSLGKVSSTDALSDLMQAEVRCLSLSAGPAWARGSVRLRELRGNLLSGNYVLVPR